MATKEERDNYIKAQKERYSSMNLEELYQEYYKYCTHFLQCPGTDYSGEFTNAMSRRIIIEYIIKDCGYEDKEDFLMYFKNTLSVYDFINYFVVDLYNLGYKNGYRDTNIN